MKKCSVIVPTMWRGEYLLEMLEQLISSDSIEDVIIIDNDPTKTPHLPVNSKINYIRNEKNIYTHASWEMGVTAATTNHLMFLSDDVKFDINYVPTILEKLERGVVIGAHPDAWNSDTPFEFKRLPYHVHSWAVLFFMKKEDWKPIPEGLKVWFGDNWICGNANTILGYSGIGIETKNESTSGLKMFDKTKRDDVIYWYKHVLKQPNNVFHSQLYNFGFFMNNCIFTTHATLTEKHARMSLKSLLKNQTHKILWDNFIIYNTHAETISNESIIQIIQELDTEQMIDNLLVFPYEDGAYPKTLTQDTINHLQMLVENEMNLPGKTLLLKSDYYLSENFNQVFSEQPNINTIWSLPIHNAKEKVSDEQIIEKAKSAMFIPVDDVTYYRGGTNHPHTPGTIESPYVEQSTLESGVNETDPRILFVSHNIQNDYNLHVFTNDILNTCLQICQRVYNPQSTWGGAHDLFNVAFQRVGVNRATEIRAFGIHMYHGIVSANRTQDRTDPRKVINGERY